MRPKIGDRIRIVSDNENYDRYRDGTWTITHIAFNRHQHPGYDEGMAPEALVDCDGLPFSLYEYEFEVVQE